MIQICQLGLGSVEADLEPLDLTEPALGQRLSATPAGGRFTAGSEEFQRCRQGESGRIYAIGLATGQRRDLTHEESAAFWSWATVEVLRHTGIRIEEMLELTHHSFIAYTLPTTGEVVPMLQVAPSKTDAERLLLVSPELGRWSSYSSPAGWSAKASLEASARDERRQADQRLTTYLGLVAAGDRAKASLMLCGGDDVTVARLDNTALTDWTEQRITSFAISGARNGSSIDGHGTVYGIHLTFSEGATATTDVVVEIIGDEPCIGTDIPI